MPQSQSDRPVVIVTGASAGIGAAIAHRFAVGGYRIVAVARRRERLEQLAHSLSGQTEVEIVTADVTAIGAAEQAVGAAIERFGRLDCLVNNAGEGKWASVLATDDASLDLVIDTSLKAPFRFCRAALPVMKAGASIINIGSVWGQVPGVGSGAYSVVKAGLNGLTLTLATDYGASGIRSNLVAPGVIKTDMTKDYWDATPFQRQNQEMTPSNRDGTVEDVANAVFFLASDQASFINGQIIALDGGWSTTKYLTTEAFVAERAKRD